MEARAVTADGRARVLADDNVIPLLGLGVWQVPDGRECEDAVRWALEAGYRHVDTAQAYGNERSVGRALRASGVPRDEVFITTKFNPSHKDAEVEAQRSLERLGVENVDLYIIHWPQGGPTWAWDGMQRARERGYARSIGVSNFSLGQVDELLAVADTPPAVNQVQFSPFEYRRALLEGCEERGVVIEAYSPLGTGRHLGADRVRQIADSLGRTPAQVLVRWSLQRDLVVLPKSTHRDRIEENAQVFDFALSADGIAALDALDTTGGTDRAVERNWSWPRRRNHSGVLCPIAARLCRFPLRSIDASVEAPQRAGGQRRVTRTPHGKETAVRKLIVNTFATLDGVMQAPGGAEEDPSGGFDHGGWSFGYWDELMEGVMGDSMSKPFDLVLGRKTYEIFAAFWPHSDNPGAGPLNKATKHVASTTLKELEWENSKLIEGEVPEGVRALKAEDGPELQVHGSANLIQTLLEHGLVDEFRVWTFPLLLGTGKRLFDGGTVPAGLELTSSQASSTGVLIATYRSGAEIKYGSFAE